MPLALAQADGSASQLSCVRYVTSATSTFSNLYLIGEDGWQQLSAPETPTQSWFLPQRSTYPTSLTEVSYGISTSTTAGAFYYSRVYPSWVEMPWEPPSEQVVRQAQRERAEKLHRAKAAIKRALKLMDNIGFGDDVRVFLGGTSVEVSHPESMFKFVLQRDSSIVNRTMNPGYSTPYKLELYTKTDVYVASLCVYMQDTPVLDQVLALSMFIKTGDEDHILKTANWFKLTEDQHLKEVIGTALPNLRSKLRLDHHRIAA